MNGFKAFQLVSMVEFCFAESETAVSAYPSLDFSLLGVAFSVSPKFCGTALWAVEALTVACHG